jgi:hypothetical protein
MITEQQRTEAVKIFKQGEDERELIKDRPDWTQEDMEQSIERTIDSLKAIGISEDQIPKLYREEFAEDIFNSEKERYTAEIARLLLKEYPNTPQPKDLPGIVEAVGIFKEYALEQLKELEEKLGNNPRVDIDKCMQGLLVACNTVEGNLDQIEDSSEASQRESLKTFWSHYVKHQGRLYGEVPAKHLGQTDLAKLNDLSLIPSEQPFIKLGRSIQRGRFKTEKGSENPTAEISGTVDTGQYNKFKKVSNKLIATAELAPKQGEESEVVRAIAEKWASTACNLGPKTDAALATIEAFWLKRKDSKGELTLKIQDIAEAIGYKPKINGSFQQDALDTVREAVRGLARLDIMIKPQIIRGQEVRGQQALLDIEYIEFKKNTQQISNQDEYIRADQVIAPGRDKPEYHWNIIVIRPNSFFRAVVDKGLTKATDFTKYRLDSVHERLELYLLDYLESLWRISWRVERGAKHIMIRTLLSEGMEYRDLLKPKRKRQIIENLEKSLEKLQEMGNVGYFEYPKQYFDFIDNTGGKRITGRLFDKILDLQIYIEAGPKYKAKYSGKLKPPTLSDTVQELQDYIIESETSNAMISEQLSITTKTVNNWLSGKNKPSAKAEQQIKDLLESKDKNPELDLF